VKGSEWKVTEMKGCECNVTGMIGNEWKLTEMKGYEWNLTGVRKDNGI